MSKASATALSSLKRRAKESDQKGVAAAGWSPAILCVKGVSFERQEGSDAWLVRVEDGVTAKWLDVIREGNVAIKIVLGKGAELVWLVARSATSAASYREVEVQMHEGAHFLLAEAFELGVDDCHGESVSVEMVGESCHAELVGRWAQSHGSQLCQESLGVIRAMASKSFFDQSSKSLKKGDARLTLLEPNLRVEVDEARANHGAAHGQVDEMSMHALMSRGLGRDMSSRLVVASFLGQAWKRAKASQEDLEVLGCKEGSSWI